MKEYAPLIILMAAIKFVLPFLLFNHEFDLHRDEFLYYQQGQHLTLGYLENPSLLALLAKISALLGSSFFAIKFWPSLFGAATVVVTLLMVKEFGGGRFAIIIASIGIICTAYMRIHFLFQPNFLEVFFWTLSAYFVVKYINTGQHKYLYFLFISLAFAFWSKYSVLFFGASIIASFLLTRQRKVFTHKHFWAALLVAFVVVLPNVLWQASHHWPLLHHMQELRATQLQYVSSADFLLQQMLMLLFIAPVWIGGLVWVLKSTNYKPVGYTFILCVLLIMLGSGKGYYTLGAYPMLIAAGGTWLQQITLGKLGLRIVIGAGLILLFIPTIPLQLPISAPAQMAANNKKYNLKNIGILKWEDQQNHPLQQDFADMLGWQELAQKAEKAYIQLTPKQQSQTIIYCRNYGQAGALKYYATHQHFKQSVISDNGSFLLWIPANTTFNNLIFIGSNIPGSDDVVFQHFESVHILDSVANPLSRQYGDKVILYINASDSARYYALHGLAKMKAVFGN